MGLFDFLNQLHVRHERLKTTIHEGWRYPLPRWGRVVMGCIYFTLPVIGGWHVMQWAIGKSHASIGIDGEYLPVQTLQGLGDKAVVRREPDGPPVLTRVGAGGWGGGVRLAVSDEETQQRNHKMLQRFLRQQKKRQLQQRDDAQPEKEP